MKVEEVTNVIGGVLEELKKHFNFTLELKNTSKSKADKLLEYSSNLENYLRQNFLAKGRGLGEMTRNVRSYLKSEDENLLLYIASERNRAVHVGIDRIDFNVFESNYLKLITNIKVNYPKTVWDYS